MKITGWFLSRVILLNAILFGIVLLLGVLRNLIENLSLSTIKIPFQSYLIALFLANFIYLIGNLYEIFYLALWKKPINIKEFEKKFFKVGLVLILIINFAAVILYVIEKAS